MSFRSVVAFASVSLLLSLATGCAAEASSETTQAGEAALSAPKLMNPGDEGRFKLYEDGDGDPDSSCDLHTVLELDHASAYGPLRATLHEALDGVCKLAVNANERAYTLKLDHVECGSKIYKGTPVAAGKLEVTITDHRTRVCRDAIPAEIVVEEMDSVARSSRTLLSYEAPRAR